MKKKHRTIRIKIKLASEWANKNPLLKLGEPGIESDTFKTKVGDGLTRWNDLPYMYYSKQEIDDKLAPLISVT